MSTKRILVSTLMLGALSVGTAGCDVFAISGALAKIANCEIGALTGTEIRVLSEAAASAINTQDPSAGATPMTQQQAQAVVNFLAANSVSNCDDLENLINQADQDPSSLQGLAELAAAFAGTGDTFDPDNVSASDLQNIFDFF